MGIEADAIRRMVTAMMDALPIPRFRWAIVDQAVPLRIKYPGEQPLPYTPSSLCRPVAGQQVLTVSWPGRLVVLGASGGPSTIPFVPTLTNGSLGSGTATGTITKVADRVTRVEMVFDFGAGATVTGTLVANIPGLGMKLPQLGTAYARRSTGTPIPLLAYAAGVNSFAFVTTTTGALVNGTVPHAWTSGDSLVVTALCETS